MAEKKLRKDQLDWANNTRAQRTKDAAAKITHPKINGVVDPSGVATHQKKRLGR